VRRGTGPIEVGEGSLVANSEGEHASIALAVASKEAGGHPPRLGFRFHFVDGKLPARLATLPGGAWCPMVATDNGDPLLAIYWTESRDWNHEAFCFRMYVTAVDSAGNESAASNVVGVWHDGNQDVDKAQLALPFRLLMERQNVARELLGEWQGVDQDGRPASLRWDHRSFVVVSADTLRGMLDWSVADVDNRTGLFDVSEFDRLQECFSRHGIFQCQQGTLRICVGAPGAARPQSLESRDANEYFYELTRPK
jgi:hypothetical protein